MLIATLVNQRPMQFKFPSDLINYSELRNIGIDRWSISLNDLPLSLQEFYYLADAEQAHYKLVDNREMGFIIFNEAYNAYIVTEIRDHELALDKVNAMNKLFPSTTCEWDYSNAEWTKKYRRH